MKTALHTMFWRLFLSYLFLIGLALIAVLLFVLSHVSSQEPIAGIANDVVIATGVIAMILTLLSYIIARQLTRPLNNLIEGAKRIAGGELGHKVDLSGSHEVTTLGRTFSNMSDRLAATFAQLEHDREQFRTILSGMVEGVIAFDNAQRVLFANDRAGELLEFRPEMASDRKLWEVVRQPAVQRLVEKALDAGGPYREELDWKGPEARTLAVYVSRLPAVGGLSLNSGSKLQKSASPGAVMVISDLTELRRLEKLRQDFVANVSHELKTPLAVIQSNIEALQDGAADDPQARGPFLDRVQQETTRLDELIRDLLRLARIESGVQLFELGPVRIHEAIGECLDRHATRVEAKSLQVVEVPAHDARDVAVWADDEAIGHIFDNLIDNAIKYTPSGGRISLRWSATQTQVMIEIQDTGIGISERDLPRVFERFYRADKARSRDKGGTGLGLAIVKHLVSNINGQVTVSSQLGVGTTFKLTLPRSGV